MFYKYLFCIYKCRFCKCCPLVFVLNTVWPFSGYSSQDCEKTGISCLTMHCNLSALAKEESRTIDIYMLLNTEILKKVSPEELYSQSSFKNIWIGFLKKNSYRPLLKLSWPAPWVILLQKNARETYQIRVIQSVVWGPAVSASPGSFLDLQNPRLHSGLTKSASLFKQEPQMFCLRSCFLDFFLIFIFYLFGCARS